VRLISAGRAYEALPVWAQNIACSIEGRRVRRQRFGRAFFERLEFLERSVSWTAEALADYQLEAFRSLLDWARERVPHYRAGYRVDSRDIGSFADLAAVPVLNKETVRTALPSLLAENTNRRTWIRGRTSGTTNTALQLWFSPAALVDEFATVWRHRRSHGVNLDDANATFNARLIAPVSQRRPPYWRYNAASKQVLFSQHHACAKTLPSYLLELDRRRCEYWQGYPSFMALVADAVLRRGRRLSYPPRTVFSSSETLLEPMKRVIAEATGARVLDRYGVGEFCVSMTECREGNLHTDMEMGIVEVLPSVETETTVTGELVVTGFANRAMPLIRYRIGDTGTVLKRPCPCGRAGQVFSAIEGRVEDYIVTPDGAWLGRMDHIFKDALMVREAQFVQTEISELIVRIATREGYAAADERRLFEEIRLRVGPRMRVRVEYLPFIPRLPNGKFRAVISDVGRHDTVRAAGPAAS